MMSKNSLRVFTLAAVLLTIAGCAPVQTPEDEAPPQPQNLLGSTDEFQLVTELSLNLAEQYGGDRVLVVLEIDDLLLTANQDVGCPRGPMHPTQADVSRQVSRMQEGGLKVIALTSRATGCRRQTLEELGRNDFSFQSSAWPPPGGYPEPYVPEDSVRPVIYEQGVFFASGQDKGLMLKELLKKSGGDGPAVIVVVDHSQASLNSVMQAFSWTSVKVHAWLYTRDNAIVQNH